MRLSVAEAIHRVAQAKTKEERLTLLRGFDNPALRQVLRYTYDPRIKWLLPEGTPPYRPLPTNEQIGSELMLLKEARTMYLFVEGGEEYNPNVTPQRREQKFIELLESVHPEDAKVLVAAKDRKMPYPEVDAALVQEAFPGLLG